MTVRLRSVDPTRFDVDGAAEAEAGIFGLPYSEEESTVVLLGVPWEPTTSYGRGTADGPAAIRAASPQLDLFDPELAAAGLAEPWRFGIAMPPLDHEIARLNALACKLAKPIIEAGGVKAGDDAAFVVDTMGAKLNQWVMGEVGRRIDDGHIVGVVGGDHSVSLGSIAATAQRTPALGVLHIDAHADLRVAYEGFRYSHASVMHGVLEDVPGVSRIVQVGVRDLSAAEAERIGSDSRIETFFDHSLRAAADQGEAWATTCERIIGALPEHVYVSFDIDGLDPSLCPGTGTPVPGGLGFGQAMSLLRALAISGRTIVGFDLVEVAPRGLGDEWDGNVGARVLYRLCGAALCSHGATS